jgi:uncharacterized protein (DUF4415 family)
MKCINQAYEGYERFRQKMLSKPSKVEEDFIEAEKNLSKSNQSAKAKEKNPKHLITIIIMH